VTVKSAPGNTANWEKTIADVILRAGGDSVAADTVSVSANLIEVRLLPGSLVVPDGESVTVTLAVLLKREGIEDNSKLLFRVDGQDHGFLAENDSGSEFAGHFDEDVVSAVHTVVVHATELRFASGRPAPLVGVGTDFSVCVMAVDANGNVDTDFGGPIELGKLFGGGTVSSASGLSRNFEHGLCEWTDVRVSVPGILGLVARTVGLREARSTEIAAGAMWVNEIDYDNPGYDTNEWIELVGWAGFRPEEYELVFIDQSGKQYGVWNLGQARWTFADQKDGYGFLVFGRVAPGEGRAGYTPSTGWTRDKIQNGPADSVQLRHKSGANVHLVDYGGNNPFTPEDQATGLSDRPTPRSSLFLSGSQGSWFGNFFWTNTANCSTPGWVNQGQRLGLPPIAPSVGNPAGAFSVGASEATLTGRLFTGYPFPCVFICLGPQDGGTLITGRWARVVNLGLCYWGDFSTLVTGLIPGRTCFYRCYARNQLGEAWAEKAARFTTFPVAGVPSSGAMYLDNIGIGKSPPLCIDADRDGLSDEWERKFFGTTSVSAGRPMDDQDDDGSCDLYEYVAGTDPTDRCSVFRGISLDVAPDTSRDMVLSWTCGTCNVFTCYASAGDSILRTYGIVAASHNVLNPYTPVATLAAGSKDILSWRDENVVPIYKRRYYRLTVSLGGATWTNSEEWAFYTQERKSGQRYLICVPVKYGRPEESNLSSSLGQQLARGLYAGRSSSDGDRIQFIDGEGRWQEYVLVTNTLSGGVYWYDEITGKVADVPIWPGMALWVVRGTNRAPQSLAVFAGRSWSCEDLIPYAFTTNHGGWTMFGWPLAREGRHRSDDPTPNQLGFYAVGRGGKTSDPRRPQELGDQIWVWEENTWKRFYWLMDGIGPGFDGRWWDDFKLTSPRFADITLEPGRAYYYFHPPNRGATNFTWKPQVR
ncbi:MAG: hypothetical protein N2255_04425, partial [Kiritimatiellae bacterium]|nr:hypothetical protein [Kiritimatiellia bacterium]